MALVPKQQLGGNRGALYTLRDAIIELQDGVDVSQDGQSYGTAAVDTGRTFGGATVWRKTVVVAAGPTANTVNVAHSITGLAAVLKIEGVLSGGGSHHPLPVVDTGTPADGVGVVVGATNISLTSAANWSTLAGRVTLEYTVS